MTGAAAPVDLARLQTLEQIALLATHVFDAPMAVLHCADGVQPPFKASVEGRGGDCKAAMVTQTSMGMACGVSAVVDQKNSPAWNGLGPARGGWTSSGALGVNATP